MELPHMLQRLGTQQDGYEDDDFNNYVERGVYEIQGNFTALEKAKQALRQNLESRSRRRLSGSPTNSRSPISRNPTLIGLGGRRNPVMSRSSNIGRGYGHSPTVGSNSTKSSQSLSKKPPSK